MNREQHNPVVFVVGCPRSGTTLLQRMLDSHPRMAVANDTHFIPRCLEKHAPHRVTDAIRGRDIPLTAELATGVTGYRRFTRLGLTREWAQAATRQSETYQQYVSCLYDGFAALHGKQLAGEKTPDYIRRLPVLHGLFPEARTIHIIRDGRDVALSALQWATDGKGPGKLERWAEDPIAVSAVWWRWQVQHGRQSAELLGPGHYTEVCYDDLVAQPERELRRLAAFLELPFAAEMLNYHAGRVRSQPGLSAKKAWLPPTPGLRNWRREMAPRDVELFEAIAGSLLEELGLERAYSRISPEVERKASSILAWWKAHRDRREAKVRKRARTWQTAGSREG